MTPLTIFALGLLTASIAAVPLAQRMLRRAEERARIAEGEARQSQRLAELGSMTSGLAHEIKNPLSTILLNAQLLREAVLDSELPDEETQRMARRLDSLVRECTRLRGILEDFLQFAGRIHLSPERVDLSEMLDEMTDFFLPQCAAANVTQRVQRPQTPVMAEIDTKLFKQALLNLMINAVHAMESQTMSDDAADAPSRELMLRLEERDDDQITVHVIDTGPGIEAERLESIFHPYVSAKRGGTGLGLPTARRIIEEHGGTLVAHSEVGRGSDFVVTVPRRQESPGSDDAMSSFQLTHR